MAWSLFSYQKIDGIPKDYTGHMTERASQWHKEATEGKIGSTWKLSDKTCCHDITHTRSPQFHCQIYTPEEKAANNWLGSGAVWNDADLSIHHVFIVFLQAMLSFPIRSPLVTVLVRFFLLAVRGHWRDTFTIQWRSKSKGETFPILKWEKLKIVVESQIHIIILWMSIQARNWSQD